MSLANAPHTSTRGPAPTAGAGPSFRLARAADAGAVAELHADSWRRNYRGAYADAFLDGDVLEDRIAVWSERLHAPDPSRHTILAEDGGLIGFANSFFDEDPTWGTLLDNLHVAHSHQRRGVGAQLLALTARAVARRPTGGGLYLWVLEQNAGARAFYEACGANPAGCERVTPPGGVAGRLAGAPAKLRYRWAQPGALAAGLQESQACR
jgi:GNAT superfamily N-acetyltransferase